MSTDPPLRAAASRPGIVVVMGDGGRCFKVLKLSDAERELGPPEDWQAVLNRAARIKLLRELEPGAWLHEVEDSQGAVTLYLVEPAPTS